MGQSAKTPYRFRLRPGLRAELARLNLSQNELARLLGVSSGFMSQLLTGRRYPGPRTRRRLLGALSRLTFDDLFEQVDPMNPVHESVRAAAPGRNGEAPSDFPGPAWTSSERRGPWSD